MARYRRKKSRRASKKISITGILPVGYLAIEAMNGYKANGSQGLIDNVAGRTTGFVPSQGKWEGANLIPMASLLIGGYAVRKVGNRVAKNPFMGLPLRW